MDATEQLPATQAPTWEVADHLRVTRRRRLIASTHGHVATPYPAEGCARCAPRVVTPRGTR